MEILIILFTILFAILSWKRLDLAAALTIIFLPVYQIRFSLWFLPMTMLEAMILILFIVWFVKSWQADELPVFMSFRSRVAARDKLQRESRENIKRYPFWREIIAILIIAFISAGVAGFTNDSLGILKAYFIEAIMFFIVFINIFSARGGPAAGREQEKNKIYIFRAIAISAFIISLVAIYQKITGNLLPAEWAQAGRMTGVFSYPNALGLYLGPIALLLAGWTLNIIIRNKLNKILVTGYWLLVTMLSILSIYLAKSEGALIGVAAGAVIFALLYNKWSRIAVIAIIIAGVAALGVNTDLRHGIKSKIMLRDLDGQIRRQMYKETWTMIKDGRIIQGAGLANYQNVIKPYHQEGIFVKDFDDPDWLYKVRNDLEFHKRAWQPTEIYLYPHNILLNFWSELGLAGALLFVWIILKFLVVSYKLSVVSKESRTVIIGLIGAMIVIIIHGLVDAPYFKNDLAVMFWVLVGMMGAMNLEFRNKNLEIK